MHTPKLELLVVAAGCMLSMGALAQDKPDGQWRSVGGAAFAATSGNTSTSSFLLNADAARATAQDKISLGAAFNYARNKTNGVDQTTANKWGAFGQYDYNLTPEVFAFGRLGLDSDKLIFLNLRTSLAGGLGYKVINSKELAFTVFGGAGYTIDKYGVAQTVAGETDTSFSRASLYLGEESSHQLSPTVSFKQRLDLFPGISGDKALLAKFTAGLSVAMSSTLNLTLGVVDSYNSKPPVGFKSNDLGVFTGINVKFGAL